MEKRHEWMVEKLVGLEEFARMNDWIEVADILRIARRAAAGDLWHVSTISKSYQAYENHWFESVIDQLTRHAHELGLSDVEQHLLDAREAWDSRSNNGFGNAGNSNSAQPH